MEGERGGGNGRGVGFWIGVAMRRMGLVGFGLVMAAGVAGCASGGAAGGGGGVDEAMAPPPVVKGLDMARLEGTWYEIANIPAAGEKKTAGAFTFNAVSPGRMNLSYRWHAKTIDGAGHSLRMVVTADANDAGVLHVSGGGGVVPATLYVVEIATDDTVVTLGSGDRQQVYLLTKESHAFADTFGESVRYLATQGYPTDKVQLTTQPPSAQ